MVNIIKQLVPESKYGIKCPYKMTPTRIVVHNTANDATARNEIAYMTNNNYETSFHYAVDDKEIVQGLPLDRNGWHASDGNGKGNREGIAIEICYSKSGGDRFIKAEQNAVDLIVYLLKKYNWGIDRVTKHQDYTNKYCPHRTLDMGWDRFLNMIKAKLEDKPVSNEVNVYYQVETKEDGVLPMVKNLEDYAGWSDHPIRYLAMKADKGGLKYRVTTTSGLTLPWVTECDINNHNTGCAGNGEPIALVEAYYFTPNNIRPYRYAYYKVNNYPYQKDLIKGNGFDGFGGVRGVPMTKFQMYIGK